MADPAQGTVFKYATSTVPKIESFSGPSFSAPIINVSDLATTCVEKIASGISDGGQLTLELNFEADNAIHDAIADAVIAGSTAACVLTFLNPGATTTTYSFTAFPTEFTPSASTGEALKASVTLDITGEVSIV